MRFEFQGTGRTSSEGGGAVVVIVVLALLFASSAVAVVSAVLIGLLIAVASVVALVLGGAGYLVYRAHRRPLPGGFPAQRGLIRPPVIHQLSPEPERPAIAQHLHLHFGNDADPVQVASVLRQVKGERGY